MLCFHWIVKEFGLSRCEKYDNWEKDILMAELKFHESFLYYFDKSGNLENLQRAADNYLKGLGLRQRMHFRVPFRFPINIDLKQLEEKAGIHFVNLLLDEPHVGFSFIHKVVMTSISTFSDMPNFSPEEIQIPLRLKSWCREPMHHTLVSQLTGVQHFKGILTSISESTKYLRSKFVKCKNVVCINSRGWRLNAEVNVKNYHCFQCTSDITEIMQARDCGDRLLGLFVPSNAYERLFKCAGERYQAITAIIQDELCSILQLGGCYSIIGHYVRNSFFVWNIENVSHESDQHIESIHLPLSNIHHEIMNMCQNSAWGFVAFLASQIATDIFPTTSFLHLKMAILLNLASQGHGTKPVPLLAIGNDSSAAQALLRRGALLAQCCIPFYCSALNGQTTGIIYSEDNTRWNEAGPLILAHSGICYLGEWNKFKSKINQSAFLSIIESGCISLQCQNGVLAGKSTFPLKSSVWTYFTLTKNCINTIDQAKLRNIIHVFGVPFLADDNHNAEKIASFILAKSMGKKIKDSAIQVEQLKNFVLRVSKNEVKLEDEALNLIRNYFVASRRVRADCLPVGSIETITSLAKSHARLALKEVVTSEDVIAVLYLYEESINAIYGPSCITPYVKQKDAGLNYNLPAKVYREMSSFSEWLQKYIYSLIGDSVPQM